jgi:hypothetical protein
VEELGDDIQDFPNAVEPLFVFGFHEHRSEGEDFIFADTKEGARQACQGQVQIASRGLLEDALSRTHFWRPDYDIELRFERRQEASVLCESAVQFERRAAAALQALREFASANQGQEAHGGPQSHG